MHERIFPLEALWSIRGAIACKIVFNWIHSQLEAIKNLELSHENPLEYEKT
jgi:hypothetical protein